MSRFGIMRSVTSTWSRLVVIAWAGLAAVGCSDDRVVITGGDAASSGEGSGTSTSGPASTSDLASTSGPATTASLDDSTSLASTGAVFLGDPDVGQGFDCDYLLQNCPAGLKCMLWNTEGGDGWQATRCTPLADDPAQVGEPCQVQEWAYSGIDDCDIGQMCWVDDAEALTGTCIAFCMGSGLGPLHCNDPGTVCYIYGDGLAACLPICDPLAQDCPAGQACYPLANRWTCGPDASGDLGAYGDPCEFINVCDPGLICLDPSTVPPGLPCAGAAGCCTEVCDITDPAGDLQCTGAAEGQTCQAWYPEGDAPVGLDNVGACALPA